MENKFKFSNSLIKTAANKLLSTSIINEPGSETGPVTDISIVISKILDSLHKTAGLSIKAVSKKVLGDYVSALYPLSNEIVILEDEYHRLITPESYWLPVIIAHEIGHWVLHAPTFKRFRRQLDLFEECRLASTYEEIINMEKKDMSILNRQANLFARELLLPEGKIITALNQLGYFPPIIYKEHHLSLMSFEEYARRLAEKVHQFLSAPLPLLTIRLLELGFLQNHAHPGRLSYSA